MYWIVLILNFVFAYSATEYSCRVFGRGTNTMKVTGVWLLFSYWSLAVGVMIGKGVI